MPPFFPSVTYSKDAESGPKYFVNFKEDDLENILNLDLSNSIFEDLDEIYLKETTNVTSHLLNRSNEDNKINTDIVKQIESILSDFQSSESKSVGFYVLLVLYAIIIFIGISGNGTVLVAVLCKKSMRTPHNLFIAALAVSDLLLCMYTMPINLWQVLRGTTNWPFGPETQWVCRFVVSSKDCPLFMSSMAIVTIAWDRYRCVLHNIKSPFTTIEAFVICATMVFLSGLFASPLFFSAGITTIVSFNNLSTDNDMIGLKDFQICQPWSQMEEYRTKYQVTTCFLQFIFPMLLVISINFYIVYRIRRRPSSQHRNINEGRRRANRIIIAVTCIFFISWLPFNIFSIITALKPKTFNFGSEKGNDARSASNIGQLVYGFLHLLGSANACTNPILYGLLNENFLKQYKRLYRWLPGYYGERGRRHSIPNFQRNAINPHLERQNAFRIHRMSIYPSQTTCQSKETTEEHLAEPKIIASLSTISCDGWKENSHNREIKDHNHDNADLVVDSPSQVHETSFQQQLNVRSDETNPYCLSKFSTNLHIPEYKILQSKTQMKDLVHHSIEKDTRNPTETKNAFIAVDDSNVHSTSMIVPLNKRKLLGKSSLSLDDTYNDDIKHETSKIVQVDAYKHKKNLKPEIDDVVPNNPCLNCSANNEVNSYVFAVSHNPKSPVYSMLIAKNKIKYIETIKKMDDVDSAYTDDYYSPCPTTTDSLATNKTFDFDNIGGNVVNKQMLESKSFTSNYEESEEKLTSNVYPNSENYQKNNTETSTVNSRPKYDTEPICSCEAFNHEVSSNNLGITQFKEKSPLNKTDGTSATLSFKILQPPKSKMVLKASLLNEVIVQNETYV